jgi:hypothetical protein
MTSSTVFPESLWPIRDAVIDLVHAGKNPPPEISEIYEWLNSEGWDDLVGESAYEESVIELYRFCENDSEVRAIFNYDDTVEITDKMRIEYTRYLLGKVITGEDDSDNPTIAIYHLEGGNEKSVVIGGRLDIQQGGLDVTWEGVFLTSGDFMDQLEGSGIYLIGNIGKIDDSTIISFWNS